MPHTEEPEIHTLVSRYEVSLLPDGHPDRKHLRVTVEYRGEGRWTVNKDGGPYFLMAKDGKWSCERPHAESQEEWHDLYLHDFDTAMTLATTAARDLEVNGRHVLDILKETSQ